MNKFLLLIFFCIPCFFPEFAFGGLETCVQDEDGCENRPGIMVSVVDGMDVISTGEFKDEG